MPVAAFAPPPPPAAPAVVDKPRPAVIASATRAPEDRTGTIPGGKQTLDGSTRTVTASATTSTTPGMRWVTGPAARQAEKPPVQEKAQETRIARAEPARDPAPAAKLDAHRPPVARSGTMIQIGATDEMGKANELLSRARTQASSLAGATPFTEKVQKGSETLYRARFAGLSESQAEAACKSLKRSGFACFTTKN